MRHILLTITILLFLHSSAFAKILSVRGESVNLRSGPGTDYEIKWEYGKGFPLQVLDRKGVWYKVRDFERDTGWIHNSLLSDTPYVIIKVNRNSKKQVNIRSGPSTKYEVVGTAYYGVVLERIERRSGWSKVKHDTGLTGWIKDTLVWGN